jgi:hypothetical protein
MTMKKAKPVQTWGIVTPRGKIIDFGVADDGAVISKKDIEAYRKDCHSDCRLVRLSITEVVA